MEAPIFVCGGVAEEIMGRVSADIWRMHGIAHRIGEPAAFNRRHRRINVSSPKRERVKPAVEAKVLDAHAVSHANVEDVAIVILLTNCHLPDSAHIGEATSAAG